MEISLYVSGNKTLIAKRSNDKISVISLDARIIFKDPDLLRDRFLLTLRKKLGVEDPKQISKMIFGISGEMDSERCIINSSHILNELAAPRGYTGFNFKDCFGYLVGHENIYLLNDAAAISLGFRKIYPTLNLPIISLLIDIGVGVSLINENGDLIPTEMGHNSLAGYNNKASYKVLSQSGIDELLLSSNTDFYQIYSNDLIVISAYYTEFAKNMLFPSNNFDRRTTVCIWSEKSEFIDEKTLKENQYDLEFVLPASEEDRNLIPVVGLFEFAEYQKPSKTILKIEYFSGEEKIYTFNGYKEFCDHWTNVRSFANPDNEYRVYFSDNVIKPIKIRDLNYESQLEEYKF